MADFLNFSKTKYCGLWQCPKIAWLRKYKPNARVTDEGALKRLADQVREEAKKTIAAYESLGAD